MQVLLTHRLLCISNAFLGMIGTSATKKSSVVNEQWVDQELFSEELLSSQVTVFSHNCQGDPSTQPLRYGSQTGILAH
jgi:hypothetical protein